MRYIKISSIKYGFAIILFCLYAFTIGLTNKVYFSSMLIPISLLISLILLRYQRHSRKRITAVDVFVFFMLIFIVVNNINLKHNSVNAFYFTVAVVFFYWVTSAFDDWHELAMKIFAAIGIFYAIMTFVVLLNNSFFISYVLPVLGDAIDATDLVKLYNQGYSPGFSPNIGTNAMYLVTTLAAPLAALFDKNRKKKGLVLFEVIVVALALLATGKRAHCLFVIVSFIIVYFFYNSDKPVSRFLKIILIVAVVVSVLYVLSDYLPFVTNFINRWIDKGLDNDSGRGILRLSAWNMFRSHPLFGIGWDGFKYTYNEYIYVHCVYLQLLCEVGLIGALPFFLFFGFSLYRVIKVVIFQSKYPSIDDNRAITVFALFTQIFFLLYCLTGNPLYDPPTLLGYIMSCSIGNYYFESRVKDR